MKKIIFNIFLLISISMSSQSIDLVNPDKNIGVENWGIVNDDVMGGISKSTLSLSNENNLVFNGYLSLENNGGFASSRMRLDEKTVSGVKSFKIKLKGFIILVYKNSTYRILAQKFLMILFFVNDLISRG